MHDTYLSNVRVHVRDVSEQAIGRTYRGVVVYDAERIGHNGVPLSTPVHLHLRAHYEPGKGFVRGDDIPDVVANIVFPRKVSGSYKQELSDKIRELLNDEYRHETVARLFEEQPYSD